MLKTKLDNKTLKNMLLNICNGLHFIHHCGWVHKDIKSHNILLGLNKDIKICDFGLCHRVADRNRLN